MKKINLPLITALALALFISCGPQKPLSEVSLPPDSRNIVGGQTVTNEIFRKHVVAIYNQIGSKLCTGTLIAQDLVLTAAHCAVTDRPWNYTVYFTNSMRTDPNAIYRPVEDLRIYDYSPTAMVNRKDLAILRFTGGLPAGYEPMPLPTRQDLQDMGTSFYAAGYGAITGRTDLGDRQSGTLRYTSVKIKEGLMSPEFSQFTVNQQNGHGICFGDSGGPAFIKIHGRRIVIGVASAVYSADPDAKNHPDYDICRHRSIYISTYYYLNWIRSAATELSR